MRNLVAAALLLPALALAEDAAPQLQEDPRAAKFADVERGWFVGFDLGYLTLANTPTADQAKYSLAGDSGGRAGGMVVGANAVVRGAFPSHIVVAGVPARKIKDL